LPQSEEGWGLLYEISNFHQCSLHLLHGIPTLDQLGSRGAQSEGIRIHMHEHSKREPQERKSYMPLIIWGGVGVGIGILVGVMMENLTLGIMIGVALGLIMGIYKQIGRNKVT
jgi:hypothetical protein